MCRTTMEMVFDVRAQRQPKRAVQPPHRSGEPAPGDGVVMPASMPAHFPIFGLGKGPLFRPCRQYASPVRPLFRMRRPLQATRAVVPGLGELKVAVSRSTPAMR